MDPLDVPASIGRAVRRSLLGVAAFGVAIGLLATGPAPAVTAAVKCGQTASCGTLTTPVTGNGSGSVVAGTRKISCVYAKEASTGTCSAQFTWPRNQATDNVAVVETPTTGSIACDRLGCAAEGQAHTTTVPLRPGSVVSWQVTFNLSRHKLSVTRSGTGSGTVAIPNLAAWVSLGYPPISCGTACSATYDYGTAVKLAATPAAGAAFSGWSGACAGQGSTCTVTVTADLSTTAMFTLTAAPTPSATPKPTPKPTPRPTASPAPRPTAGPSGSPAPGSAPPVAPAASGSGQPDTASASPSGSGLIAALGGGASASSSVPPDHAPAAASGEVPGAVVFIIAMMVGMLAVLATALAVSLRRGRRA
jgi:Divergent InlB B-repeat domain